MISTPICDMLNIFESLPVQLCLDQQLNMHKPQLMAPIPQFSIETAVASNCDSRTFGFYNQVNPEYCP